MPVRRVIHEKDGIYFITITCARWKRLFEITNGKLHEVFEPSFDWKECLDSKFIEQKLNYIHDNLCQEHWNLVENQAIIFMALHSIILTEVRVFILSLIMVKWRMST